MTMVVDGHTTIEHTDPGSQRLRRRRRRSGRRRRSATRRRCSSGTAGSSARTTGTRRRTSGRTRGSRSSSRRSSWIRARAGARWRPRTSSTTSTSAKIAANLDKDGVLVNTGAHGQREGLGLHWELWMLVQGGLSPHEALRCANRQRREEPRHGPRHRHARGGQARRRHRHRRATRSRTSASRRRWPGRWSTAASTTRRP